MRGLLVFMLCSLPSLAWAQDDPTRRDLINRATVARDHGDHARALTLARGAAARRMSPSLRTFIAQEEEALGDVTAALADARTCVEELRQGASVTNPAAVMAECQALVNRLSPRVVASPAREPTRVAPPVEPQRERPRQRTTVTPILEARTPPSEEAPRTGPGAGPWVVMGLGAASFAGAGAFFALRNDAMSERDALCRSSQGPCDLPTANALRLADDAQESARTYNTLINVALGVGGAAVAGGLLWFILGRSGSAQPTQTSFVIAPGNGGAWLGVHGAL